MILELTDDEAHDLYDMLYMLEAGDIRINNCQKSYDSIFEKLEKYCVPELFTQPKKFDDFEPIKGMEK